MTAMMKKLTLAAFCVGALLTPTVANAEILYQQTLGPSGIGAGQFSGAAGIAINSSNGTIYVADASLNRIDQFSSGNKFIRAWGYDVVAAGPDDKPPVSEVDEVRIRATGGSFRLVFKGASTSELPFNASTAEVQAALNGLSTVSAGGGSVTVSGTPSNYVVTFGGGPLAKTNVELSLEPSGLATLPGTQLSCEGGPAGPPGPSYQWLANGTPIPGATSATFTPGAAEESMAIQCLVVATSGQFKTAMASRPYVVSSPAPSVLPPLGPASLAAPTGQAVLESAGGTSLTCMAGAWSRNPESFTYQWYRNGVPIGTSVTTTETHSEYVVTQQDVATKAAFQCGVTGSNTGGSSVAFSDSLRTEIPGETSPPQVVLAGALVKVSESGLSKVMTRTQGGPAFEVCAPSPSVPDECKAGAAGEASGEFSHPSNIAVDNSPTGNGAVYVLDSGNARVQKFSATGALIGSFGREVDQSTGSDVCTVSSGDVCGPGVFAVDTSPGALSKWPTSQEHGNVLATDPEGNVYVADPLIGIGQPRVQKFDSSGSFVSQAKVPQLVQGENRYVPAGLAVDSVQRSYVSLPRALGGVDRILPSEYSLSGDGTHRGGNMFHEEKEPVQLAIDPRNDRILVSDRNLSPLGSVCGGPTVPAQAIAEYDPQLNEIDCSTPSGVGALPGITGMAVSSTGRLYVSVGNAVKIFRLPTPAAPLIKGEAAKSITTESARITAQVNPGFEDTEYFVEYGLESCASAECSTVEGGALHGLKYVAASVPIEGLKPATTYHYRLIAKNSLGTIVGPERTFSTFSLVDLVNDPCSNALARKQTKSVALLDCRAYELVSAADTSGYDVVSNLVSGQVPFQSHPDASGRVLYGVKDGGIPGTGVPTNRGIDPYVARRGENGQWTTRYVGIPADNPFATSPFSSTLLGADSGLSTFAFGGSEICSPCFEDKSAGVPVRLPNGELVQGMTPSRPAIGTEGYVAKALSADGKHLIFGSTAQFAPGGNAETGDISIYDRNLETGDVRVVSNAPSGPSTPEPLACLQGAGQCHEPGDRNGIAELDISSNGSRILLAQKVKEDAAGHPLWHLYLEIGDSVRSLDLTPGTASGVYFGGMTADGSRIFFTTGDRLLPEDEDESADVYEAEVDAGGAVHLQLVSVNSDGTPSNDNGCTPPNSPGTWNSPAGEHGKCGALVFAGGAGVASESGDFYFLSPELLEAGKGVEDLPNLYLASPGSAPRFVATVDKTAGKPGPLPPTHPLVNPKFGNTEYQLPASLAVDQLNGYLYVEDTVEDKVERFGLNGEPVAFPAGSEGNALTGIGTSLPLTARSQIAVDSASGSSLHGDLYATTPSAVKVYSSSGEQVGQLTGSGTNKGSFSQACGVAVDRSSGAVYVADSAGFIWRYTPASPSGPISDADYTVKGIKTAPFQPCDLAIGSGGALFAAQPPESFIQPGGPVYRFEASSFASGSPPVIAGTEVATVGNALDADALTGELYVDQGNKIAVLNSSGDPLATIGEGKLNCSTLGSRGVALVEASHHVFASCNEPEVVKEFGYVVPPYRPIDNPAISHAVDTPEIHSYGDFQVTPKGTYSAFMTAMELKEGFDNGGHLEVYAYRPAGSALTCVSCSPTGSQPESDSNLPRDGLGLLEDGRVFFNSGEDLTLSDSNGKLDAYEWSPQRGGTGGCQSEAGCQRLISTGNSAFPSGLLGVSSDGVDAFFFTRDTLVPEDHNGQAMKIYDAREGGGFFVIPPPPPCAASDECHGPATKAAETPQIGSLNGHGGQYTPLTCRKGFVKREGKCVRVRRHKHKKHHHPVRGGKPHIGSKGSGANRSKKGSAE